MTNEKNIKNKQLYKVFADRLLMGQDPEVVDIEYWERKHFIETNFDDVEYPLEEATDLNDINFMCTKPNDCPSHNEHPDHCKCIRKRFPSSTHYQYWLKSYFALIKAELLQEMEKYKK